MSNVSAAETFEQLIRQQKTSEAVPFLLRLEKKDVVPVRQKVKSLKKELEEYKQREVKPGKLEWGRLITPPQSDMLFLAGLATYSRKEALARGFDMRLKVETTSLHHPATEPPAFLTVLEHAKPDWLSDWLIRRTRSEPWSAPQYQILRELEKRELLEHEPWLFAQSAARMLNHYNWRRNHVNGGDIENYDQLILQDLRADNTLLERDIPLLFDFDTNVDSSSTYTGKEREEVSWLTLIPALIKSGHLDRANILLRSLLALRRDFRRPLLTWFKNLFVILQPTAAERLARQAELVELLAHPLALVVNFALDHLKEIWANEAFEPAPLLLYAEGLLTRQDLKTSLRTLFGGFEKLLKRDPTLAPALARLSASALANADAGVQERAAKVLANILGAKKPLLSPHDATEITESISLYADLLNPPARKVVAPFLLTGADEQTAAAAETYAPHAGFAPELSPATTIAPVQDWHELLFLTGQVIQHDDPVALERWLDGLLRLREQFPAGYEQQLRPYLHQIIPWVFQDKTEEETLAVLLDHEFAGGNAHFELVQALLISWATGFRRLKVPHVSFTNHKHSKSDPLLVAERQRLAGVEEQLQSAATPLPLLSTPTHAPYWVAPAVLVRKLLAYEAAGREPNTADLAVALARTAGNTASDMAEARQQLAQLQANELRELLDWFFAPVHAQPMPLPASIAAGKSAVKEFTRRLARLIPFQTDTASLAEVLPWLWAVAARTRYPQVVWEELRALTNYPGAATPWQPSWYFQQKSNTYKQSWNKENPEYTVTWQELLLSVEHENPRAPSPLLLYSQHVTPQHEKDNYSYYLLWSLAVDIPFLLSLLPNNPTPLHWNVLRSACRTNDMASEGRDVMQKFLPSLLGAGPHFDEPATVLLAVGLTHYAPVCRALALEVLLSAIEVGRLQPAALGTALGKILAVEFVPVQRLTDNLAQARAISPIIDDALHQTLNALLPLLPLTPPRNTRKLLDAYADLTSRTRQPVPEAVQTRLREWSSSATLKKAIGALLQ